MPRFAVIIQWAAVGGIVGAVAGGASALFLHLLEWATDYRLQHAWLVALLPLAGVILGALYERFGTAFAAGHDLVIDTLHDGGPRMPLRMTPMVLLGTVATHLFGGSAGREGTAVQMGASLGDLLAHALPRGKQLRGHFVAAGVAGGFGSVFGTPVAGLLFGLELVVLGRLDYATLLPALIASLVGDAVTRALGITHTHYPTLGATPLSAALFAKWLAFAVAVACCATAFIELSHGLRRLGLKFVPKLRWRMALGGLCIWGLTHLVGTADYLGLGVPRIVAAFSQTDYPVYAFAAKLVFTAITVAAGFLGGEVTPLFFVGAALGNALAVPLGIPLPLAAGVGMVSVFACAANTPLALSIMAVEIMGAAVLPHACIVCIVSYMLSGHRGIYTAQRWWRGKDSLLPNAAPQALRDLWHK